MLIKIFWNILEKWFFSRLRLLIDIYKILSLDHKMTSSEKERCQFEFNCKYFLRYSVGLVILIPLEFYIPSFVLDVFYIQSVPKSMLLFAYISLSLSLTMWLTSGMIKQMKHYTSMKKSKYDSSSKKRENVK